MRRIEILKRVVVGGAHAHPGREYLPGDEDDFEDGTAETLIELGVGKDKDPKAKSKRAEKA